MRTFDFAPFYRSTVGFERLFEMLDDAARVETAPNWPPYNIERADHQYRITMAVAGFTSDGIELTQHENNLMVVGRKAPEPEDTQILHRGIATRTFKQTFNLADHVKVKGAALENGLLTVDLEREVPEELKPRRIEIATQAAKPVSQDNAVQIDHDPQARKSA